MTLNELNNFAGELFWPGIAAWFYYHVYARRRLDPQTCATIVTVAAIFLIPCYAISFIYNLSVHGSFWVNKINAFLDLAMIGLVAWEVWQAWKRWKNKKKALEALGAKAKALRDKLVKNLRDSTQPARS